MPDCYNILHVGHLELRQKHSEANEYNDLLDLYNALKTKLIICGIILPASHVIFFNFPMNSPPPPPHGRLPAAVYFCRKGKKCSTDYPHWPITGTPKPKIIMLLYYRDKNSQT